MPERLDAFQDVPTIQIYRTDDIVNEEVLKLYAHPDIYHYDNPENLWEKKHAELEPLFMSIVYCVANYAQLTDPSFYQLELDGWCVTTPESNTHLLKHDHAEHADIIATYYAVNDNPDRQGDILMYKPDIDLAFQYRPFPGTLLLFPGNWSHQVTPYTGARFSIATNIRIKYE